MKLEFLRVLIDKRTYKALIYSDLLCELDIIF